MTLHDRPRRLAAACRGLVAALALAQASALHAEVRALFVGIGAYKYGVRNAGPDDLALLDGPATDAIRFRQALNAMFGFGFDEGIVVSTPCAASGASAPPAGITLLDACASRAAILAAMDAQIKAARPGDTVIFYFAGHGSEVPAALTSDPDSQASGKHSSFLPWDARDPKGEVSEILDVEFGERRRRANARGIGFVFIADYCSSGSGTRDLDAGGRVRAAPPGKIVRRLQPAASAGSGTGRSILLAAARDDEKAYELPNATGAYAGIFTTALIKAMARNRQASFIDLMTAVRSDPLLARHSDQHPRGEGDLTFALTGAGLTQPSRPGAVLDALYRQGRLVLENDGDLAGMTAGSTIALFRTAAEATTAGASPLLLARVKTVAPYSAELEPAGAVPPDLPEQLWARETVHVQPPLALALDARLERPDNAVLRDAILAALTGPAGLVDMARIAAPAAATLALNPRCGTIDLLDRGLTLIESLGGVDATFAERLRRALSRVSRVEQLLSRPAGPAGALALCLDQTFVESCPPPAGGDAKKPVLRAGKDADLVVVNQDRQPRYIYVFAIARDNTMSLVLPAAGGVDDAVDWMGTVRTQVTPGSGDRQCRYVAIATDQRLSTASWIGDAGGRPQCGGSLENASSLRGSVGEGGTRAAQPLSWAMTIVDTAIMGDTRVAEEGDECDG